MYDIFLKLGITNLLRRPPTTLSTEPILNITSITLHVDLLKRGKRTTVRIGNISSAQHATRDTHSAWHC